MKLIVKWADNKPPFAGILLEGSEVIAYDHAMLVKLRDVIISLHFEFFSDYCNIKVVVRSLLEEYYLNGIRYGTTHVHLKNWLIFSKNETSFTFGYLKNENGKQVIGQTHWGKNYVLKIRSVSYVGLDNLIVIKIDGKNPDIKKLNY